MERITCPAGYEITVPRSGNAFGTICSCVDKCPIQRWGLSISGRCLRSIASASETNVDDVGKRKTREGEYFVRDVPAGY